MTIRLWDVTTGETVHTLREHYLSSVYFSGGGLYALCMVGSGQLASGSHDNTIRLWDVTTGETVRTLKGHSSRVLSRQPRGQRGMMRPLSQGGRSEPRTTQ